MIVGRLVSFPSLWLLLIFPGIGLGIGLFLKALLDDSPAERWLIRRLGASHWVKRRQRRFLLLVCLALGWGLGFALVVGWKGLFFTLSCAPLLLLQWGYSQFYQHTEATLDRLNKEENDLDRRDLR